MNTILLVGAVLTVSIVSPLYLSFAMLLPALVGLVVFRKSLALRLMLFLVGLALIWGLELWWLAAQQPELSNTMAIQQMAGDENTANKMRLFDAAKNCVPLTAWMASTLLTLVFFAKPVHRQIEKIWTGRTARSAGVAILFMILPFVTGCVKSYDRPEYVEIDTSETGFLIPLEGDASQQARFQSEDYLKQRKIATKRVQILHRWSQEGRTPNDGRWIPVVRLVKVNRSPVTREWASEQAASNGQQSHQRRDGAIWIESADSVGFSMGFTCTAFISEEDAARFLYWYPSGSLATVMDTEVRGRIQQVAAEVAAKYPLDTLRARKQEIADAVKKDLTIFFTARGVAITTVGMFGGMTYENPEIQHAIDQTFIAQQLKTVALAKFEAQQKENERMELEANGIAEKARREASGLADARKTAAAGEAEAIRNVNKALLEAQQNPMLLQFKMIELEKSRVERWDGKYPVYYLGMSSGSNGQAVQLQLPAPGANSLR
jgi:hypothetical protein